MNQRVLDLIKIVNDNYQHIQELETLGDLLGKNTLIFNPATNKSESTEQEKIVCRTTHNSHYSYNLWTKDYKDPKMHINNLCKMDNYYESTKRHDPIVIGHKD